MRLSKVLVRFYKSFNFGYEAKADGREARPWELADNQFYPFIEIGLDSEVTAVVGANESGKSHLVSVIQILLTGENLQQRDFCRYSKLFSVEEGERRFPEVGGVFQLEKAEAATLLGGDIPLFGATKLHIIRSRPDQIVAIGSDEQPVVLNSDQSALVQDMMPMPWTPKVKIALAESVPIASLLPLPEPHLDRSSRAQVIQQLMNLSDVTAMNQIAASLFSQSRPAQRPTDPQEQLARVLLIDVARIAPSVFLELQNAIREEREGLVNGLVQQINASLAKHLNLARWWTQDPDFTLRVSPREQELVFTVRDRTGTDYSSSERSNGLVHFLGYLIQFRAHRPDQDQPEILLMDEPDAYLSASGQQDLLRLIDHYARPDDAAVRNQALYVTHSPFLVNRNAGHRIRVLDKGIGDEGTRLVKDVTRNRYEPLRSSIGVYVAETAFIGGANLFVEGVSDQILLAGTAALLGRANEPLSKRLDLNQVTVVNCGSAGSVPYMLYVARGQDEVKPPSIVLLDSDSSGEQARREIQKGGAYRKALVRAEYVVMLGEWAESADLRVAEYVEVREIEDLLPEAIAVRAARNYAENFLGLSKSESAKFKASGLSAAVSRHDGSMVKGAKEAFEAAFETSLDKLGFAKEVVRLLDAQLDRRRDHGVPDLIHNFSLLQTHLASLLRRASDEERGTRRDRSLSHLITDFTRDYPDAATRETGSLALHAIESLADESRGGDALRVAVSTVRRDFELDRDPLRMISDFQTFLDRLEALQYAARLSEQHRAENSPEIRAQ